MGTNQRFRTSASWEQSIQMLDTLFPLAEGSHGTATAYLVHFDHLVIIQADGAVTSLVHSKQFIEAGGNWEAPQSILLENNGLQVEIEPQRLATRSNGSTHRMQLLTRIS